MRFLALAILTAFALPVSAEDPKALSDSDKELLKTIDAAFEQQIAAYKRMLISIRRNRLKPADKQKIFGTIKITGREMRTQTEEHLKQLEAGKWAGPMPALTNKVGSFGKLQPIGKAIAKIDNDTVAVFRIDSVRTSGQLKGQVTFRTQIVDSSPYVMRGFDFSKTATTQSFQTPSKYGVITGLQRYGIQDVFVIEPFDTVVQSLRKRSKKASVTRPAADD